MMIESDRVERTESTDRTDKFSEALCAFANDMPNHKKPGHLIVGVDKKGTPCGLHVTEQLLEQLAALRSDGNIQPLPTIAVQKFTLPGGDVAVVTALPSDIPPVRYKGRIWIRVGPRRAVASEQEERILSERRVSSIRNFDSSPCPESSIEDLSLRLFYEYRNQLVATETIAANHRSIEEQLASLRFFDLRRNCPTMAGILLFGKNPRYFLSGSYVQFLLLPGKTLTDAPIDHAELSGDLRTILDTLRDKFRAYNKRFLSRSDFEERTISEYPEWAAREILHNAVMHRDYQSNTPIRFYWFADRIEIQSPGGLYGEVTPDTITRRNSYRNPVMAEAMKALGYIEHFGRGIQMAEEQLKINGNPKLSIDCGHVVNVIMQRISE
jgi:ATP-dependent DNA helicase RecG